MKLSILIPTKDRPDRCKRAVASALAQRGEVEVIVKNGGAHISDLPFGDITYIHGPDRSIAHALNQAAGCATGDAFHFACDDDEMTPDAWYSAEKVLKNGRLWTYGVMHVVKYVNGKRVFIETNGGWPFSREYLQHGNCVPQPTCFWVRRLWDACGPFDEALPLVFDYEMWGRFAAIQVPAVRNHVDSYYEQWDGSISVARRDEQLIEVLHIKDRWQTFGFGQRGPT